MEGWDEPEAESTRLRLSSCEVEGGTCDGSKELLLLRLPSMEIDVWREQKGLEDAVVPLTECDCW